MTDIMQQSGEQGYPGSLLVEFFVLMAIFFKMIMRDAEHVARVLEDSDRVREARVRRAGIHEVGETQLANSSQALEFRCVQHFLQDFICFFVKKDMLPLERDEFMHGVKNTHLRSI
ncbi:MAG: hypothetical protein MPJ82_05390 [Alphaproteobacteria bacterium]|nr:hypothetical protein [Alphaproteobacteria bacterium]